MGLETGANNVDTSLQSNQNHDASSFETRRNAENLIKKSFLALNSKEEDIPDFRPVGETLFIAQYERVGQPLPGLDPKKLDGSSKNIPELRLKAVSLLSGSNPCLVEEYTYTNAYEKNLTGGRDSGIITKVTPVDAQYLANMKYNKRKETIHVNKDVLIHADGEDQLHYYLMTELIGHLGVVVHGEIESKQSEFKFQGKILGEKNARINSDNESRSIISDFKTIKNKDGSYEVEAVIYERPKP